MHRAAVRLFACAAALAILTPAFASNHGSSNAALRGKQSFGALAYHRASGNFGYAVNAKTSRAAKLEALRQCGHPQCEVVASLRNSCGALASGAKRFVVAHGVTRQEAQTKALRKCGERCEIAGWACND